VLPLPPEFIAPQDGAEKQDCERNAAKRWLAQHVATVAQLRPVYLGDDLFACQPIAAAIHDAWPWSRMTGLAGGACGDASRRARGCAGLAQRAAGFGVAAVTAGIPLNLVQKWLGHAQLSTTAVYANAVGAEEKDIARRMWG
jgi:hypothetical protein